jgi:predicted protein tyrosine phosphatase
LGRRDLRDGEGAPEQAWDTLQALKARVIRLDIPDDDDFVDEALISLLKARVTRHLPV